MRDIHKGFQDVNQVSDAEAFFHFLDAADALESTQAYRQRMLELPTHSGSRVRCRTQRASSGTHGRWNRSGRRSRQKRGAHR
jgi:hypothetical protein